MNLIKLDAINSTNEFLKDNIQKTLSKELQVVYTFNQTKGKGQRGNSWESQPEKNIAISLGLFPDNLKVENQFTLSMLFSLFILNTLKSLKIPDLKIKWPNDIMSGNTKICGILNEITVKGNIIESIIVGFGINVNQENFENLPNASSLKLINNINYDLNKLVSLIIKNLKKYDYLSKSLRLLSNQELEDLNYSYHENLYKIGEKSQFTNKEKEIFIGKIVSVNKNGIIKIEKEDNSIMNYNFQEIQMIFK
ncbi:MAG: biotin--[acetyl-CoA-carboxylase] ligase [Flavobacteriaceae bacterium]|jgi:BirA family biotin operon repressor/biotin-[acetyl-CoA-carboxylase] ligase|nr:biotin--[acetyl-CoA-carboxylase] ligase [Flavobacteriaceae bacterium]MBT3753515.1 biotin--[acetyl-CoA-carboxylase] ligase [Flavobacteriaceae bacterium]MBT3794139.1 biotin--[acetyl-CoA-carboxylase] ligase [Flavobacteriaceae bacterium]MBT4062538.1 biotin--[acetyl-CoA-carboxylase] ligase [Flavobacteriaceae bacterium]MBT4246521.1 biotin--[acetyl-CoA-carboxylase] ligase [Flavobacteriaceae bacterium]|tara:strand:- start:1068 stop:1820 length:753 start_codon:yes stop_codon:yes gene_type:complete